MAAHLDAHQAFLAQQVEAVLVQLQLAQQRMGHAVRVLGDGLQRVALARRAGQARVVEAGTVGDVPEALLARLGRFALAQQHRQRPAQGVAEAVLVVLRGPQAQPEQRRRQRRLGVEQFQRRPELVRRHLAVGDPLDQHADHLAAPERHAQAHPRLQARGGDAGGRAVVEQAAQRRGQGEAQDRLGVGGHAAAPGRVAAILAWRPATAGPGCGLRRRSTLVLSAA
ncbi:hypothetical protein D9M69_478800 [compost metagenome]